MELGYALSSEEHSPQALVDHARRAEAVGFEFALISDHYHPWIDAQGHSPFVWSVLGGVAQVTQKLRIGTGVTCPTVRIHPAIIAQAAATMATLMPGRFFLGVGTGENLNEHILGDKWPEIAVRRAMLAEAVTVLRKLWEGGYQSFYGRYYTVENARLYTLPDEPLPVYVGAGGPEAAELAGEIGDGLITTSAEAEIVKAFEAAGGKGKDKYGQLGVCWAKTEAAARKTVYKIWPTAAMEGALNSELPLPAHFAEAAKLVTEDAAAESVVCGPDVEKYVEKFQAYLDAGLTHIYLHQIGPDQDGFFDFYQRELQPRLRALSPNRNHRKKEKAR